MSRLRLLLLLLALAALGLVALELFLARPLWGAFWGRGLHGYLLAGLAAALLAARALLGPKPGNPAVVAGLLAFVLFVSNARQLGSGDTQPASALPFLLLRHGTLSLDPLDLPEPLPYWVAARGGRRWSEYPVAAGILAVPFFLPVALGPAGPWELDEPAKLAAAAMAALSVAFLLALLLRLGASLRFAALVTLLYAAGSPLLSVSSQGLWQHGPSTMALAAMLWATVRSRELPHTAWLAGLFSGVAIASRATDVLLVAPAWLALLLEDRRRALRFALGAAGPALLLVAYQTYAFGAPWRTGYDFVDAPSFTGQCHVLEMLISPTRGLFTYVPWALPALVGLGLLARRDRLCAALLAGTVATVVLYSAWGHWWGGWSFGPRLLSDLMPVLAIGCLPFARVRWGPALLALTGAVAIYLHGFYAFHSGSPRAALVYEIRSPGEAMEWARHPLASWLR